MSEWTKVSTFITGSIPRSDRLFQVKLFPLALWFKSMETLVQIL
jgi:hypothetical protein